MITLLQLVQGNQLRRALSPLRHISEVAAIIFTPAGISLQASDSYRMVTAMLRINSSRFDRFVCCGSHISGVNLNDLNDILASTRDEESINIVTFHQEGIMSIRFEDNGTHETTRHEETYIADVPDNHLEIHESNYKYEVVLGIPSEEFRLIIRQMRILAADTVFVSATDEQLTFTSGDEQVVLTKENGDCIIGGVEEGDKANFRLGLHNINSVLEASELSDSVWLFKSHDSPDLLNCPVHLPGNIKFYFI